MIKTIIHDKINYPHFQAEGFAAQFAFPFAKHICQGNGYDIGAGKLEWTFPGAIPIDPRINASFNALNLPAGLVDFIFSSHCLEHIESWVTVLDHWHTRLKPGGTLFLYLPDYSQTYWRPWNNRKHVNILSAEMIVDYLKHKGYCNIFASGVDLNNSFMVIGEKS